MNKSDTDGLGNSGDRAAPLATIDVAGKPLSGRAA